jgi:predicted transcriptional regulator
MDYEARIAAIVGRMEALNAVICAIIETTPPSTQREIAKQLELELQSAKAHMVPLPIHDAVLESMDRAGQAFVDRYS